MTSLASDGLVADQGRSLSREVVFPLLSVVVIAGYADVRIPMGLPGHRGLVWLTLLVAVTLMTQRRATVVAVGAAATVATLAMNVPAGPHGPLGSTRYLAAAVLLYALIGLTKRRWAWLIALAAAPIHLVALAGGSVSAVLPEKLLFHLGFGLAAGLMGWCIASASTGPRRRREAA